MKSIKTYVLGAVLFVLTASFVLAGGDTSSVENKTYKVTMTENKKGKSGKPMQEEITFKSGKFRSKLIKTEMGAEAIPIELTKDSSWVEDNYDEMIYVEFEGEYTNKLDETVKVVGVIDGYGIEGNVELSKKGKVKRHFDFVGTQKEKKSKKKED
ncbi:MAG: hypothetical protein Fur0041_12690 [Bacteroidia bacterium]